MGCQGQIWAVLETTETQTSASNHDLHLEMTKRQAVTKFHDKRNYSNFELSIFPSFPAATAYLVFLSQFFRFFWRFCRF